MKTGFLDSPELAHVCHETHEAIKANPVVIPAEKNCVEASCFASSLFSKLGIESRPVEAAAKLFVGRALITDVGETVDGQAERVCVPIGSERRDDLGWSYHMVVFLHEQEMIFDFTLCYQTKPPLPKVLARLFELDELQQPVAFYADYNPSNHKKATTIVGNGAGLLTWAVYPDSRDWETAGGPLRYVDEIEALA